MNISLNKFGYHLHCSYTTYDGRVLKCYTKLDLGVNRFAYELDGKVIVSNIEGKKAANEYFVKNFLDIIDVDSKVMYPRNHLFAIHYHISSRKQDKVNLRSGKSVQEVKETWLAQHEFAIANHGYQLIRIEEIY